MDMLQRQLPSLCSGNRLGRVDRVRNLSPVDLILRQLLQQAPLAQRDIHPPFSAHNAQIIVPNLRTPLRIRCRVGQCEVHAQFHCRIERGDAVGRQEDDAAKVHELLKEDGDERITLCVLRQEAIRLKYP